MVKIINFGSLNIDYVYQVPHFVRPGETLPSAGFQKYSGGKGGNQSIALGLAGAKVSHAGKIGQDSLWLVEGLQAAGVDTSLIEVADMPTGHAIIQVTPDGENAIVLHGGANHSLTPADIARVFRATSPGDILLTQNEINRMPDILRAGRDRGMTIVFNPAPFTPDVRDYPLHLVDMFVLNEIEGAELTQKETPEDVLSEICARFPHAATVLTIGAEGVLYRDSQRDLHILAEKVIAVDTTAAGDTFIGYFLATFAEGREVAECLRVGCKAAGICVQRRGAADSIPHREEVYVP